MPLSKLDPSSALIVIDLQKGILAALAATPIDAVLRQAGALAAAFRRHGLPVVLVNVAGAAPGRAEQTRKWGERPADWLDFLPELQQQPGDHTVTKRTWGAFSNTDLETYLRSRGVTQVVIAGVSTSAGVESTARQAHELGFNVTLALDAMADTNPDAHLNSVTRIFPRLGETGTAQEILDLLAAALNERKAG